MTEYIILTDVEKNVLESLAAKLGLTFEDLSNVKRITDIKKENEDLRTRVDLCEKACLEVVKSHTALSERIQSLEEYISNMQREEMGI